jgi:hypothetical protein
LQVVLPRAPAIAGSLQGRDLFTRGRSLNLDSSSFFDTGLDAALQLLRFGIISLQGRRSLADASLQVGKLRLAGIDLLRELSPIEQRDLSSQLL